MAFGFEKVNVGPATDWRRGMAAKHLAHAWDICARVLRGLIPGLALALSRLILPPHSWVFVPLGSCTPV